MRVRVLAAACGLIALSAGAAQAGDVTVTLEGIQARGGVVYVSLQTEDQFMQPAGFGQRIESPAAGPLTVVFENVPAGRYAFSAFHDENGDMTMQASEIGIPTEGWAMTNGEALRGPPTFDVVAVDIGAEGATLTETMHYWDGAYPGR